MERQANYALVGALSVILILGGLVFIVWLAQFQFNQTYDEYRINFHGPVSGLSKGGEVQFNGIPVGEIVAIRLDARDPNLVITDIQVEHGTPVRIDSQARTQTQGITGVKFVQISPGTPTRALLREASRDRPPVIAAEANRMDAFVEDISSLMAGGAQAIERINRILSDRNIATISQSLDDVGAVTAEVRQRRAMFANIESTFARFDRAAAELQLTAASARSAIGGPGRGTLGEISTAASELRAAVADMRGLIGRTDGSMAQLSATTLPELNATLGSIQAAAVELQSLTADIRQDPRATFVRAAGREVEVPR
jgi:phospholipid/cholesterol/gamma-HCH transport system substrate-binding protein